MLKCKNLIKIKINFKIYFCYFRGSKNVGFDNLKFYFLNFYLHSFFLFLHFEKQLQLCFFVFFFKCPVKLYFDFDEVSLLIKPRILLIIFLYI